MDGHKTRPYGFILLKNRAAARQPPKTPPSRRLTVSPHPLKSSPAAADHSRVLANYA
jgi:hypothetical protein